VKGEKRLMTLISHKSTKNARLPQPKLNPEETFWKEVEARSKTLIADLIEKVLPISAIPSVFDLEKDTDYRVLLREDLPMYYQDNEEYQAKIANQSWTAEDVECVSQDLVCAYFNLVVKVLVERLSDYAGFETTELTNLKGI
jgi:hypothetical protein